MLVSGYGRRLSPGEIAEAGRNIPLLMKKRRWLGLVRKAYAREEGAREDGAREDGRKRG